MMGPMIVVVVLIAILLVMVCAAAFFETPCNRGGVFCFLAMLILSVAVVLVFC